MQGKINGLIHHLRVVFIHKYYVMKYCFRLGLYYRGIVHDMSKFSKAELLPSARFFTGTMSPQVMERKEYDGYSYMSVHHCNRNTHHYQYHVDFSEGEIRITYMPLYDVLEMFCDSLAASIVYSGKGHYERSIPYAYFHEHMNGYAMHPATKELLLYLFKEYEVNDFQNISMSFADRKYKELLEMYPRVYRIPLELERLKPQEDLL